LECTIITHDHSIALSHHGEHISRLDPGQKNLGGQWVRFPGFTTEAHSVFDGYSEYSLFPAANHGKAESNAIRDFSLVERLDNKNRSGIRDARCNAAIRFAPT
jgi:hypothetical protein